METMSSNNRPLVELEAEIVELEETILDRATRDRLLDMPKKLFTEAQEYHRKGSRGNPFNAEFGLQACRTGKKRAQEVELPSLKSMYRRHRKTNKSGSTGSALGGVRCQRF
jgi:hypothetical protein